MLTIRELLKPEELATLVAQLTPEACVDGRETALGQAQDVKRNLQLPSDGTVAPELDRVLTAAVERHDAMRALAMPRHLVPFRFARYEPGMSYGWHIDHPLMAGAEGRAIRTDLACTVFLTPPASYGGGELTVQTPLGNLSTKLPAGDAILYPADSIHRVEAVTHGVRLVAVTWIQSVVASAEQRQLLQELFQATRDLRLRDPQAPEILRLTAAHSNLIRMWGQT